MKWVWQSNSPGSNDRFATSTASSPSSDEPTSTIAPSATTTSPRNGLPPVPSNTKALRSTVRVGNPTSQSPRQKLGPECIPLVEVEGVLPHLGDPSILHSTDDGYPSID